MTRNELLQEIAARIEGKRDLRVKIANKMLANGHSGLYAEEMFAAEQLDLLHSEVLAMRSRRPATAKERTKQYLHKLVDLLGEQPDLTGEFLLILPNHYNCQLVAWLGHSLGMTPARAKQILAITSLTANYINPDKPPFELNTGYFSAEDNDRYLELTGQEVQQ